MIQKVEVDFSKKIMTNSTEEKSGYSTVGVYEIKDNTKILTYFDNESKSNVRLIYNNEKLVIKTKGELEFKQGEKVRVNYVTDEGPIVFITDTRKIFWENETIDLDYTLYHFDEKIGDYEIKIEIYKMREKNV